MQVYNGSSKGKLIPWYSNLDKSRWYSDIDVAAPQAATPYGTASVKAPIRPGYSFLGWYAPELDSSGNFIYKSDGTIKLSDVPVYDTAGLYLPTRTAAGRRKPRLTLTVTADGFTKAMSPPAQSGRRLDFTPCTMIRVNPTII